MFLLDTYRSIAMRARGLPTFSTPEQLAERGLMPHALVTWDSEEWKDRIAASLPVLPPCNAVGDWVSVEGRNVRVVAVLWDRGYMGRGWLYHVPGLGSCGFCRENPALLYQYHVRIGEHSWRPVGSPRAKLGE